MKTFLSWFWLLYGLWVGLLALRVFDLTRWPWRWLLAPAWVVPLALAAFALLVFAFDGVVRAWFWVAEVLAARRRLRLWRRIQDRGLREFFVNRELSRQRGGTNPRACKPPFQRS